MNIKKDTIRVLKKSAAPPKAIPVSSQTEQTLYELRIAVYEADPHILARNCDCSVSTIYSFRSGRTRWPRDHTLFAMCRELNFEVIIRRRVAGNL